MSFISRLAPAFGLLVATSLVLFLWLRLAGLSIDQSKGLPSSQLSASHHILGPVHALATQGFISNHNQPAKTSDQSAHEKETANLSRVLVAGYTTSDDISWIAKELPQANVALYAVDDGQSSHQVPVNKGHEAMVYLTYIIDHFYHLPDVLIFVHAHRHAWHNLDLLDGDAVQMYQRLRSHHVVREGYVNLRCDWHPGCPTWLFPLEDGEPMAKQEQAIVAKCWHELFPLDEMPLTLAQPCCAQFAVSRERIHAIPLQRFIHYRDWLLQTPLTDYFSGRVWEFVWQYVFSGNSVVCPREQDCYCSTYGICLETSQYEELAELKRQRQEYQEKVLGDGQDGERSMVHQDSAKQIHWRAEIQRLNMEIEARKTEALSETSA